MPARRTTVRIVAMVLALGLLAYGLLVPASTKLAPAPALPHDALQGGPVTLAAVHGHPEVIAFFATWCTACHHEASAVAQIASSQAGRGRILAVDDADSGNTPGFLAEYHWTFPVLNDPDSTTAQAYGVLHLPTTVLLNAKGEIVARDTGPQTVASLTRALAAAS